MIGTRSTSTTENRLATNEEVARPFLKWAGGKSQLLPQFLPLYPEGLLDGSLSRYIEPFVGGGAVFLDVAQRFPLKDAVLIDINRELILTYRVVQKQPEELIKELAVQSEKYYALDEAERSNYFYEIRDAYNAQRLNFDYEGASSAWPVRAAWMIFLNKTCFNGLYRVNSSGEFNVPYGRYKRPLILDEENIRKVSRLLKKAKLRVGSYKKCRRFVNERSFVYFDPPYRPISATSNFTQYSKDSFDDDDQKELAGFYARLDSETGAKLMLSNSDPQKIDPSDRFFESLYSDFHIQRVYANRMISSNGQGRGKIPELLITNYEVS